jgi:hypothetical protein
VSLAIVRGYDSRAIYLLVPESVRSKLRAGEAVTVGLGRGGGLEQVIAPGFYEEQEGGEAVKGERTMKSRNNLKRKGN